MIGSFCEVPVLCLVCSDGIEYELQVVTKTSAILYHEVDRGGVVHEIFCDVTVNGRKGWGLAEFFYRFVAVIVAVTCCCNVPHLNTRGVVLCMQSYTDKCIL